MKKNTVKTALTAVCILALTLPLTACGKKGGDRLPSACSDALKNYAKLSSAQKDKMSFSLQLGLDTVLEQGKGSLKTSQEIWSKNISEQYDAIVKLQNTKAADAMLDETEQQCEQWEQEIKVFSK